MCMGRSLSEETITEALPAPLFSHSDCCNALIKASLSRGFEAAILCEVISNLSPDLDHEFFVTFSLSIYQSHLSIINGVFAYMQPIFLKRVLLYSECHSSRVSCIRSNYLQLLDLHNCNCNFKRIYTSK